MDVVLTDCQAEEVHDDLSQQQFRRSIHDVGTALVLLAIREKVDDDAGVSRSAGDDGDDDDDDDDCESRGRTMRRVQRAGNVRERYAYVTWLREAPRMTPRS